MVYMDITDGLKYCTCALKSSAIQWYQLHWNLKYKTREHVSSVTIQHKLQQIHNRCTSMIFEKINAGTKIVKAVMALTVDIGFGVASLWQGKYDIFIEDT